MVQSGTILGIMSSQENPKHRSTHCAAMDGTKHAAMTRRTASGRIGHRFQVFGWTPDFEAIIEASAGDSEWMASDMAADFGHSWRGRTLQRVNRASSLLVLAAVGSVVAPDNTVMISASVSARARSHQGLLYISSDDPFS